MKNSAGYTKTETNLDSLERIKLILDSDPSLILDLIEENKQVIISTDSGAMALCFDSVSWPKAIALIVEEIKSRPNPDDRYEGWECRDSATDFVSFKKRMKLVELRKNYRSRIIYKRKPNKHALKKLCDEFKLPLHMGQLFVNELKLDSDPVNDRARQYAKFLGLF